MATIRNYSDFESSIEAGDSDYSDEVMFSGWNPTVAACQHDHSVVDMAMVDADQILHEIYE